MRFSEYADPIVAIATAAGRGAVGIVRLSGGDPAALISAICGRRLQPRQASYGPFLDAAGEAIDHGLALHFPAPHSYTGEHVLELQAHGGPVVLQLLLARCLEAAAERDAEGRERLPRLRLASPGEFTRRAFLNDKIDLAQAEAVADLIDASTEAAARSASRSLAGAFSADIAELGQALVSLRVLVEATLDFPDEEIDFLERAGATQRLAGIAASLARLRAKARQGALLREGMRVVLAGQPNVGKSSLLNALAGAELAIVTPIPGTTRDKVRETIQIEGVPLHVTDTAGLRGADEAADEVERIGIARSWQAIAEADAIVLLHDLTMAEDRANSERDAAIAAALGPRERVLHVYNKADAAPEAAARITAGDPETLLLSARTGEGLATLRAALLARAGWQGGGAEGVFIARTRHVEALARAAAHVDAAIAQAAARHAALELCAEELRLAHDALGEITGRMTADDLLGEIFRRFCIGK